METKELRDRLITSLGHLCDMEFFNCVSELYKGEALVLNFLMEHDDTEVNPSLISAELNLSRSGVTAALSTLRKKNYVVMEISPMDRRRMIVSITPPGAASIKKKIAQLRIYFEVFVEGLGERKAQELLHLVDLSVEIMNEKYPIL